MPGAPASLSGPRPAAHRVRAFGLEIESGWPLTGSHPASPGDAARPPATRVTALDADAFAARWAGPGERIFEPEFADGRRRFTVDRGAEAYRLWLEDFGRYLVARDGGWIACEQGATPAGVQERFVFAQALPVAAVLHGYEVLHAGAVCGPAGAAAFVGPSGTGKTTLTTRLLRRGARLMTDDVLALEVTGAAPLAHPGPPFMAIHRSDAGETGPDLGPEVGRSDKLHIARAVPDRPATLRAVYHLARGPSYALTPLDDAARHAILAHAFVPYLRTPERLLRHLEIGEQLNRHVAQFRLQTPPGGLDDGQLDRVHAHLTERGAL